MRRASVVTAGLGLSLLLPARAPGGLYNFAEPAEKFGTFDEFRSSLKDLRQINPTVHILPPHRQRYLLVEELAQKGLPAGLSDLERVNFSGYLLRLRKEDARQGDRLYQLAVEVLQPVVRRDPKNFLAQANLATAYQKLKQEHRALDTLSVALSNWPKTWGELPKDRQDALAALYWNPNVFTFYREAETYQRKLWLLRLRETQRKAPTQELDALFDRDDAKVNFVGPDGKYALGKIAPAERSKLPPNALAIVEQLVLWQPEDLRLIWLAGEFFNAEGQPRAALTLFRELVEANKYDPPEMKEHRRILADELKPEAPPPLDFTTPAAKVEAKDGATSPWPTNPWQLLGVGFGAGALVALLGVWQVREIRRRRS